MKRNRKAKILATLGPASSDKKIIEDLFVAGCDVFRLNFSHGDLETHRKNYETIRSLEEKHNHASCILADLQGPKLRVGIFTPLLFEISASFKTSVIKLSFFCSTICNLILPSFTNKIVLGVKKSYISS